MLKLPTAVKENPFKLAETAQKGLETKWEGLVTILSLVSNLPKKVIPQKSFGRPPSEPQAYHCKITQSTGVAAQMQLEVVNTSCYLRLLVGATIHH